MRRVKGVSLVLTRNLVAGPALMSFLAGLAQCYSEPTRLSLSCMRENSRGGTDAASIVLKTFEWKDLTTISFTGHLLEVGEHVVITGKYDFAAATGRISWDA
jgi:hypothetical protein